MTDDKPALNGITPYICGTTRLGDLSLPHADRLQVARAALQAEVWFHTSRVYGDALEVLGEAFKEAPAKIPRLIIKIGWDNISQLRGVIEENLRPLGLQGMQLGQLCLSGDLAQDFANGGNCYKVFQELKNEGLVQGYVVEVFPWTSWMSLKALQQGYTEGIVDGFIFYLNPLQRFASNVLWNEIMARNQPVIALRTISGGPVHLLRDVPGFAWKEYLRKRAKQVAPIFERSGIPDWTEFCVRFAHSLPQVRATVGSTSKVENLNAFLDATEELRPLSGDIMQEILALQSRWSDEFDLQAEPWSM